MTAVLLSTGTMAQQNSFSYQLKPYRILPADSGFIWIETAFVGCHSIILQKHFLAGIDYANSKNEVPDSLTSLIGTKRYPLIAVHGEVYYDFFYRSKDQTGLTPDNLQQHTERVSLRILWKNKIPLRVGFASRQSNSFYQPNFFDPLIQLDWSQLTHTYKQKLVSSIPSKLREQYDLDNLEKELAAAKAMMKSLPAKPKENSFQKLVREREKHYFDSVNHVKDSLVAMKGKGENLQTGLQSAKELDSTNSLNIDSIGIARNLKNKKAGITKSIDSFYLNKKKNADSLQSGVATRLDSLAAKAGSKIDSVKSRIASKTAPYQSKADSVKKLVDSLQSRYDSLRNIVKKRIDQAKQIVNGGSASDVMKLGKTYGINTDSISVFQSILLGIKSLSLGRSQLDYSELTVSNISLTGINLEYNSGIYLAAAAGKIDYRFRDYYSFSKKRKNDQYLIMGRIGYGDMEKKALIFSVFTGRKNQFQFNTPDSVGDEPKIIGYSVQLILKKNRRTGIIAEYAKSTRAIDRRVANQDGKALWKFNDQSNAGFSINGFTSIPETNTDIKGSYRSIGENFQSFNVFTQNVKQVSWNVYLTQHLVKNKIQIDAGLRHNDFTNPIVQQNFKTSNVFKSLAVSVRVPKYPFIKIGYYPGTQEFRENDDRILQNVFYILNGTASHNYKISGLKAYSLASFTRYINQSTDSGFALYRGATYYVLQNVSFRNGFLQAGFALNEQPDLTYRTLEAEAGFSRRRFSLSGGVQYHHVMGGKAYYSPQARFSWTIPVLGIVQFQYSKTFLPTTNGNLYPIEYGRFTYQKTF